MEQREPRVTSGIFDKKRTDPVKEQDSAAEPAPAIQEKEVFKDPFELQSDEIKNRAKSQRKPVNLSEMASEQTANAVNNAIGGTRDVSKELEEMDKVSPKDLELAEQMIFKGYAETDVEMPNVKNHKFTICSTSAEEMALIDEVLFDMVEDADQRDDGTVNIPQNHLQAMRNALFIAISYRGMDKTELSNDSSFYLNTIKKAIIRVSELEDTGKLDEAKTLKKSLKSSLKRRATLVKRLATPLIDFLSSEKYAFDNKMLKIMTSKGILPKS